MHDNRQIERAAIPIQGGCEVGADMGIQEFVNKKLVRVASMDAPA